MLMVFPKALAHKSCIYWIRCATNECVKHQRHFPQLIRIGKQHKMELVHHELYFLWDRERPDIDETLTSITAE